MADKIVGATKGKLWRDAIRRAVQGDSKKLDKLARVLVQKAEEGDMMALKEIGDRLDGKPAQAITGGDGGALVINVNRG